jgi:hypothetical protein
MAYSQQPSSEETSSMSPKASEGAVENEASNGANKVEDQGSAVTKSSNTSTIEDGGAPAIECLAGFVGGGAEESAEKEVEVSPLDSSQSESDDSKAEDEDQFTSPLLQWYNPFRNLCGKIVNDTLFQLIIVLLIVVNGAMSECITQELVHLT